jgi:hypothetical protein
MAKAPTDVFPEDMTPQQIDVVDFLENEIDEKIAIGDCSTYTKTVEVLLNETYGNTAILTETLRELLNARYLSAGWRSAYVLFVGNQGKMILQAP